MEPNGSQQNSNNLPEAADINEVPHATEQHVQLAVPNVELTVGVGTTDLSSNHVPLIDDNIRLGSMPIEQAESNENNDDNEDDSSVEEYVAESDHNCDICSCVGHQESFVQFSFSPFSHEERHNILSCYYANFRQSNEMIADQTDPNGDHQDRNDLPAAADNNEVPHTTEQHEEEVIPNVESITVTIRVGTAGLTTNHVPTVADNMSLVSLPNEQAESNDYNENNSSGEEEQMPPNNQNCNICNCEGQRENFVRLSFSPFSHEEQQNILSRYYANFPRSVPINVGQTDTNGVQHNSNDFPEARENNEETYTTEPEPEPEPVISENNCIGEQHGELAIPSVESATAAIGGGTAAPTADRLGSVSNEVAESNENNEENSSGEQQMPTNNNSSDFCTCDTQREHFIQVSFSPFSHEETQHIFSFYYEPPRLHAPLEDLAELNFVRNRQEVRRGINHVLGIVHIARQQVRRRRRFRLVMRDNLLQILSQMEEYLNRAQMRILRLLRLL